MLKTKKLFAIIIAVALLSTLCMQSFAAETDNDQRFTERQRNVLLALGASETDLATMTWEEVNDLLRDGELVNPQYISQYLPTEADHRASLRNAIEEKVTILRALNLGLTGYELELYLKSTGKSSHELIGMTSSELQTEGEAIQAYLLAQQTVPVVPLSLSTNYTLFSRTGTTPNLDYAYSSCYIHKDALSTAFSANATPSHYAELKEDISSAKAFGDMLFNTTLTSASQYSYNLWGDVNSAALANGNIVTHQGIDFTRYENAHLYVVCPGTVIKTTSEYGGTTIFIYNDTLNMTFVHMHTKNVQVAEGTYVSKGTYLADQGRYISGGSNNTHTHFEVRSGRVTSAAGTGNEMLRTANPYYYGLYFS